MQTFILLSFLIPTVPLYLISLAAKGVKGVSEKPTITHLDNITPQTDANTDQIKVITYNVGYASGDKNNKGAILTKEEILKNLETIAETIRAQNPDVIAIQEADLDASRSWHINQIDYLAKQTQLPYVASVITWNKRYVAWPFWPPTLHFGQMVSGQVILSRYPILDYQTHLFEKPKGNPFWYNWFYLNRIAQKITVEFPSKKIALWNLHLEAFDTETRQEQAQIIANKILSEQAHPTLILGDFNSVTKLSQTITPQELHSLEDHGEAISVLSKSTGFTNAEPEAAGPTFPSWNPIKKIDHIFYSKDFILLDAATITGNEASDHLPLMAVFE